MNKKKFIATLTAILGIAVISIVLVLSNSIKEDISLAPKVEEASSETPANTVKVTLEDKIDVSALNEVSTEDIEKLNKIESKVDNSSNETTNSSSNDTNAQINSEADAYIKAIVNNPEEYDYTFIVYASKPTPVYSEMDLESKVIGSFAFGDTIHAYANTNGWYLVDFNETFGYVPSDSISLSSPTDIAANTNSSGNNANQSVSSNIVDQDSSTITPNTNTTDVAANNTGNNGSSSSSISSSGSSIYVSEDTVSDEEFWARVEADTETRMNITQEDIDISLSIPSDIFDSSTIVIPDEFQDFYNSTGWH